MMVTSVSSFMMGILVMWVLALPVEVTPTDGAVIRGSLAAVTPAGIQLEQDGTVRVLPFDSLVSLEATAPMRATPPVMRVTLAGGSELAAHSVSLQDDLLSIELRRQDRLSVPARQVRSIRFRASAPATDAQWFGLVESEGSGDVLAIRREGDRLDQVRGVIESITGNVVQFNVDGTAVQAPFDRLEGIVFGSSQGSAVGRSNLLVLDSYGSRWMVDSLRPSSVDEPLKVLLESDVEHSIPMSQVTSIRWNSSLVMLATQPAAEQRFKPAIGPTQMDGIMGQWFSPTSAVDDALVMHGDSMIEYRVEPGFERVMGSFLRDERVDRRGKLTAIVAMDGEVVWTQELLAGEASGFELPLGDHRRLQFRTESSGDGDLGDTVHIVRPRLLK